MTFAHQLRKVRIAADISQSELARRSGINRTVVNRYESGHSTPEIENLTLLCDALDVSADVLLGRINSKPEGARRKNEITTVNRSRADHF